MVMENIVIQPHSSPAVSICRTCVRLESTGNRLLETGPSHDDFVMYPFLLLSIRKYLRITVKKLHLI